MRCLGVVIGLYVVLSSSAAFAQGTADARPDAVRPGGDAAGRSAEALCRYARAVAESQSSVMMAPQLFATGGLVSGSDSPTGPTTTTVQPRVIAGLQYSAAGLYRGIQTRELADAECKRYDVFSKLLAFTFVHAKGDNAAALRARLAVLDDARSRSEGILERARTAVAEARMTTDTLDATTSRIDAIRAATVETRGKLRVADGSMSGPQEPLSTLLVQRDRAERTAEERAARVRQSQAWDVSVRAGYDQIFGQSQQVPVFGAVTVSFNPGLFWQQPADARAETARVDAARTGLEHATLRAQETARELRELARAERERLDDVTALLDELETRHRQVSQVQGDRAEASADSLWLGMVPVRAEKAYLQAHVVELAKVIGEPGPAR